MAGGSRHVFILLMTASFVISTASDVSAEHWIAVPPPPEMRGDDGYWWLDDDTVVRNGKHTFFTLARGTVKGEYPTTPATGRMAIDCTNGEVLTEQVCTGSCQPNPVFPRNWVLSSRYAKNSSLYDRICYK
jgi:hypothetical protein